MLIIKTVLYLCIYLGMVLIYLWFSFPFFGGGVDKVEE